MDMPSKSNDTTNTSQLSQVEEEITTQNIPSIRVFSPRYSENVSTAEPNAPADDQQVVRYRFNCVHRVTNLPIVVDIINYANGMYKKIKSCNCITRRIFKQFEKSLTFTVQMVGETCPSIESPLGKLDSALCKGLDLIETYVPAVKLTPNEIYDHSKKFIHDAYHIIVVHTNDCVNDVKQCGTDTVHGVQQIPSCLRDSVSDAVKLITSTDEDQPQEITVEGKNEDEVIKN
ncbi:lipid storage droplets surface-binding protein 1-like [Lycorma delicatula]|uniref:lipid storage droplets surface-binding protein 1-like n=1 Tax=Lycorma delicatula TaxID=130591 RepID=UPI003F50EF4F